MKGQGKSKRNLSQRRRPEILLPVSSWLAAPKQIAPVQGDEKYDDREATPFHTAINSP